MVLPPFLLIFFNRSQAARFFPTTVEPKYSTEIFVRRTGHRDDESHSYVCENAKNDVKRPGRSETVETDSGGLSPLVSVSQAGRVSSTNQTAIAITIIIV
jgi:hypothetical protein